jgi:hypothetical protein
MSVSLYMDHHVPSAVTEGLRDLEVDVVTIHEDGRAAADDPVVLERVTTLGRAVYTQDDDFLALARDWLDAGREFAGVIYAHQLHITIGKVIQDLELIAKVLDSDEMYNRIEFLPFR